MMHGTRSRALRSALSPAVMYGPFVPTRGDIRSESLSIDGRIVDG